MVLDYLHKLYYIFLICETLGFRRYVFDENFTEILENYRKLLRAHGDKRMDDVYKANKAIIRGSQTCLSLLDRMRIHEELVEQTKYVINRINHSSSSLYESLTSQE